MTLTLTRRIGSALLVGPVIMTFRAKIFSAQGEMRYHLTFTSNQAMHVQIPGYLAIAGRHVNVSVRCGEQILLDGQCSLTIIADAGRQIKLGIDAPPQVLIWRAELLAQYAQQFIEDAHDADDQLLKQ
jgi:carbon storage regulator CsrA